MIMTACTQTPHSEKQPNILLITIDTLRADHLSVYGFNRRETPYIDRLAEKGVLFQAAYCDVTWTTPSMASTLTGTYSYRHRLRSSYDRLSDSTTTIAETLKTTGYHTAAVIGSYPLDSIYGLDQGFDIYDDSFTVPVFIGSKTPPKDVTSKWHDTVQGQNLMIFEKVFNKSRRNDPEVTNVAIEILSGFTTKEAPFFLWAHYFGPHSIEDMNKSSAENLKRHIDTYPDKVVRADMAVGRLLKTLDTYGLSDNTLVILHADHGESLGQHGFIGHGRYLYEDDLRVPLIMRWPGKLPTGKQRSMLVGNIDIAATILDAAGISDDDFSKMDGLSLLPAARKGKDVRDSLYIETYMPAHEAFAEIVKTDTDKHMNVGVRRIGVFKKPWKYIRTEHFPLYSDTDAVKIPDAVKKMVEKQELYNIEKDPGELNGYMLSSKDAAEVMHELTPLLSRHTEVDQNGGRSDRVKMADDHFEKLKSLGYIK